MRTIAWVMTAVAMVPMGMGPAATQVTALDGDFAILEMADDFGSAGLIIADGHNGWIWASTWDDAVIIHSDGTVLGGRGPALDLLVSTMEDPETQQAFPLLPWVAPFGILLIVLCIDSCDCCWAYYNGGGSTQNEPPCCDRCLGSLCDMSVP